MIFILAFLGGLILNLMPCVLPIIAIKILTITQNEHSKVKNTAHYVLGVSFSFLVLSSIIVIANFMGKELGWGYHMQSSSFVMCLMYIFFLMGMNLIGAYEISMNIQSSNKSNMFLYGILTTISSTPCLAPFLSTAAGFAITQGNIMIIIIFQVIALGLAFPYVVLGMFPKMIKKLPKSGKWNHSFKEFLSFPLFATAIWLLWVAVTQTDISVLPILLSSLLLISLVSWIGKISPLAKRLFFPIVIMIMALTIIYTNGPPKEKSEQINFSLQKLEELTSHNKKVFVVVTANWCITCKLNEGLFLNTESFKKSLRDNNVTYMVADWTNQDVEITNYMHSLNYSGVPMYVFYGQNKHVEILPTLLSSGILKNIK